MKVQTGIKAGEGLGNTVEDIIHITGLDRIARMYTQITGNDCGCEQRKEYLNQLFPFQLKTT